MLGPFHIDGSPELGYGEDMSEGLPGTPLLRHGTVRDLDGNPVAGAVLDVWQADADGAYESQLPDVDEARLRAKYTTPRGRQLLRAHHRAQGLLDPDGRPGRRADRAGPTSATSAPPTCTSCSTCPATSR